MKKTTRKLVLRKVIVRELSGPTPPRVEEDASELHLVFATPETGADRRHYARAAKLLESIGGALEVRPTAVVARLKKSATAG